MMRRIFSILIAVLLTNLSFSQDVQNSRKMSQKVVTTRTIGTTDVTITYHSPLTKGRKIFGGIVPYDFIVDDKEYAWRAGSNNRTTIEFTHDVAINGHSLKAGKYGLVVLVSEKEWTFVFSSNRSWGAFQYDPINDVLRVPVATQSFPFQEWLSYDFINPKVEEVELLLRWEESGAAFTIATDVNTNILDDLKRKENKGTRDYRILAIETIVEDSTQIDVALEYLEQARLGLDTQEERMQNYERFTIDILKADLMIQKGELKEGKKLKRETIENAQGFAMYYYGLNTLIVKGDKEEAFRLLSEDVKRNPEQWQSYLAMGEYYLHDGNQEKVVENFKKAFAYAPDNWRNYARYLYLQNHLILERQ